MTYHIEDAAVSPWTMGASAIARSVFMHRGAAGTLAAGWPADDRHHGGGVDADNKIGETIERIIAMRGATLSEALP